MTPDEEFREVPPVVVTAANLEEVDAAIDLVRRYLARRALEGRPLSPDSTTAQLLGDLLEARERYLLSCPDD